MIDVKEILKKPLTCTLISVIMGLIVSSLILMAVGYNPLVTMEIMFQSIFSRPKFITNVIIKSTPIILTGLSVAFAFKTGLFNIGAEGQYIAGTIASTIVGILLDLPAVIQIPVVIFAGVLAGALWGGFIGFLRAKFGIHEVITSIMVNWITLYLCNYFSNSSIFHKPESNGTYPINDSGLIMILYRWKFSEEGREILKNNPFLNDVLLKTDLNAGFLIALVVAILIWVILYKTKWGYEFRAVGLNPYASANAGINVNRSIINSMLISGALSGLAGALAITGNTPNGIHILSVFENNGFNGLAVALIAGSSPIGCIFSGLLFSALIYSGQSMQFKTGTPSEIVNIMIGVIVFFVALTQIIPVIVDRFTKRRGGNVK